MGLNTSRGKVCTNIHMQYFIIKNSKDHRKDLSTLHDAIAHKISFSTLTDIEEMSAKYKGLTIFPSKRHISSRKKITEMYLFDY